MPRQLPWKSSGGSRMPTVKQSARSRETTKILNNIDDDFFDSKYLARGSKGKGKAKSTLGLNNSSPEPSAKPSAPLTDNEEITDPNQRAVSSSPPPPTDDVIPVSEPMRNGVSKFDLRDDEWMMVEDEFLETAKLFTRHLHIAEYDRLKETIEAKKKEAETARPVVAGAKRSVEGAMKERAKTQESKQKRAIRDVFAAQEASSEDEKAPYHMQSNKASTTKVRHRPATSGSQDTDSDDLDAPQPPRPKNAASASVTALKSEPAPLPVSGPETTYFAKPTLPAPAATARSRARPSRLTPFHMLDEYTPPISTTRIAPPTGPHDLPRSESTSSTYSSPQTSQTTARTVKSRRSMDLLDDREPSNNGSGMSEEVAARIAKRKAERTREGDGEHKKRATRLDDIPTFLF